MTDKIEELKAEGAFTKTKYFSMERAAVGATRFPIERRLLLRMEKSTRNPLGKITIGVKVMKSILCAG